MNADSEIEDSEIDSSSNRFESLLLPNSRDPIELNNSLNYSVEPNHSYLRHGESNIANIGQVSRRRLDRSRVGGLEDVEDSIELLRRWQRPASLRPNFGSILNDSNTNNLEISQEIELEANRHQQRAFIQRLMEHDTSETNQLEASPTVNPLLESMDFGEDHPSLDEEEEEEPLPMMLRQQPVITIEEVAGGNVDNIEQCAICQEDLNKRHGDSAYIDCMHWYHFDCIKPWLSRKSECPICKHPTNQVFKIFDENNPLASLEESKESVPVHPDQPENPSTVEISQIIEEPGNAAEVSNLRQGLLVVSEQMIDSFGEVSGFDLPNQSAVQNSQAMDTITNLNISADLSTHIEFRSFPASPADN